jgi:hypothetical protein
VVVKTTDHIVAGALVTQVWSLGGTSGPGGNRYASFLIEPFFNYNFGHGWFVNTTQIIACNEDGSGRKWKSRFNSRSTTTARDCHSRDWGQGDA